MVHIRNPVDFQLTGGRHTAVQCTGSKVNEVFLAVSVLDLIKLCVSGSNLAGVTVLCSWARHQEYKTVTCHNHGNLAKLLISLCTL